MTIFFQKKKIISEVDFFLISINLGSEISFFGVPEAEKGVFIFRPRGEIRPSKGIQNGSLLIQLGAHK